MRDMLLWYSWGGTALIDGINTNNAAQPSTGADNFVGFVHAKGHLGSFLVCVGGAGPRLFLLQQKSVFIDAKRTPANCHMF